MFWYDVDWNKGWKTRPGINSKPVTFDALRREFHLIESEYRGSVTAEQTSWQKGESQCRAKAAIGRKKKGKMMNLTLPRNLRVSWRNSGLCRGTPGNRKRWCCHRISPTSQVESDQGHRPPSGECWYCHQPGLTKVNCPALECLELRGVWAYGPFSRKMYTAKQFVFKGPTFHLLHSRRLSNVAKCLQHDQTNL